MKSPQEEIFIHYQKKRKEKNQQTKREREKEENSWYVIKNKQQKGDEEEKEPFIGRILCCRNQIESKKIKSYCSLQTYAHRETTGEADIESKTSRQIILSALSLFIFFSIDRNLGQTVQKERFRERERQVSFRMMMMMMLRLLLLLLFRSLWNHVEKILSWIRLSHQ